MILHLGKKVSIGYEKIIGIFDMDTATKQKDTKNFIRNVDNMGIVNVISEELPKSFIIEEKKVHISPISTITLKKRIEKEVRQRRK